MPHHSNSSGEVRSPASIAQKALTYITECRLPPTPKAYELWYRYFEGANQDLTDELASRMANPSSINLELVESLHLQHCSAEACGDESQIADKLSGGIIDFKSIIEDQKSAGDSYSLKLQQANEAFEGAEPSIVVKTAGSLTEDTRAMQRQMEKLRHRVVAAEQHVGELQADLRHAQSAMMTDHLTGLGNRRYYESMLRQTVRSLKAGSVPGIPYLILVDCDKFKTINDTFGHPFGDAVIQTVAEELTGVREDACVARLGGDEFAVFSRFSSEEEVAQCTDGLLDSIGNRRPIPPESDEAPPHLSISVGVARIRETDSEDSWHSRADKMLYQAKNLGGNRAFIEKTLNR